MSIESPGRGKFAELMADHVFADKNRNKLPAVVHADRVPDHFRSDRRAARPGTDDLFLARIVHRADFLNQMLVDKGPFFDRTRHGYLPFLLCTMYLSVDWFFLVL